jgi:glycosyltransferase involved in cell wall biosynthesis
VAEGMAAKIPVLVSDNDGPMEVIENGKYGYYFESGDAQSLADKIEFIITHYNYQEMNVLIENAYLRVKSNFDIKLTANKYIEEYKKNS